MKLVDFPRSVPIAAYDAARWAFLQKYEGLKGVSAILEFGTVSQPGISDMDFFVVVEPGAAVSLPHMREYALLERYVMGSLPVVVSQSVFPFLQYEDPWFVAVRTIYDPSGTHAFRPRPLGQEDACALSMRFLYEKVIFGCLPVLANTLRTQTLHCLHFFAEFAQFSYFFREWRKFSVPYGEEDPALPFYADIVARWFSFSSAEQCRKMEEAWEHFQRSVGCVLRVLLPLLSAHLVTRDPPPGLQPKTPAQRAWLRAFPQSLVMDTGDCVFIFQRGQRTVQILVESFTFPLPRYHRYDRTLFIFPWEMGAFATPPLFGHGSFTSHCRWNACTDLAGVPLWKRAEPLLFQTELSNRNFHETRNVRNAKYYERTFGYRPTPACSLTPADLRRMLGSLYASLPVTLARSHVRRFLLVEPPRLLWNVAL